jgi:predicted type IV restriction endonuclease
VSYEQSLNVLENLDNKFSKSEMNESDTRFQIIDKIIKHVFYWPDSGIKTETHTNEGYTDYQLQDKDKAYLVIEAKQEKIKFNFSEYSEVRNHKMKVKVLMKDENTKKTILQVKNYCQDIGCKYACITNGHEWAFFRAYIDGESWQDGNAYIISSLAEYIHNFNEINKYFTYNKIVKDYSFKKLFDGIEYSSNERYEPKRKINGYDEQIKNNYIAHHLKGYFEKYFGEISPNDKELLHDCYVAERGYKINFENMTNILEDVLSPYMSQEKNIQELTENNTLSKQLITIIKKEKKSKVLILFGGKGAGKTTFLVSLFNSNKNKKIKENSVIAQINLLKVANDQESIKNEILSQLIKKIDIDNLLSGSNKNLKELFKDKFDVELKQSLEGLSHDSETFIVKRNELLKQYKEDKIYCLARLANYLRNKNKAIIINIDNTDQFDQNLQDYCFSLANQLSEKLYCLSIISLREERYTSSSIEGYLDAYEKNGFHISSPNPRQVFLKRLIFIAKKINSENKISRQYKKDISILFDILKDNLDNENSEFNKFMMAATHGNIRQGLELFKNFIFSNYTNVAEMINRIL